MTDTQPLETLRDAIQDYIRADSGDPDRIVTDFIVGTASIQFSSVEDRTYYRSVASGTAHACIGLADILTEDIALDND